MRGDMILYHWKIFNIHHRLPLKLGTRQKGWTKEASFVKKRSKVFCCNAGVDWVRRLITAGISTTVNAVSEC